MKPLFRLIAFIILVSGTLAGSLQAQTSYNITVKAGPMRQSFAGFGASQADKNWDQLTPTPRNQMADMVYRDLKMNVFRMWMSTQDNLTPADMASEFNTKYVASGAVSAVMSRGVTTLLLAPHRGGGAAAPASISTYADNLAQAILLIKNTYGVTINVTGIANEPEPDWSAMQIVDCVKYLRSSLDSRGLSDVKIIATESSSHSAAAASAKAIANDSTAWSSLYGVASHSYQAMNNDDLPALKQDKPWWITEASGNDVNEQPEDEDKASTILARYLCEMNQGADKWIFFIGLGEQDDVSTYSICTAFLMLYDRKTSSIVPFLRYYYFKQALNTFDVGCIFRKCVSITEGNMFQTTVSGTKYFSAVNAAAGYNPDGSWGINIQNETGVTPTTTGDVFPSATTYNVTVTVEELASTPTANFTVFRSRANNHFVTSGTVTLVNGIGTVAVAPKELVSLRSGSTALTTPPVPDGLTASTINAPVSLVWNNTVKATSWHVKRATTSGGPYTTIATPATTSYEDNTAVEGTVYYYVVSAVNSAGESANSSEAVASPAPFPWSNVDVGAVGLTGSCVVSDDAVFTTYGAGTFISNTNAAYNLTYHTMTGNGTLIARVAPVSGSLLKGASANSVVGIMMTETLSPGSKASSVIYNFNGAYLKAMMCNRITAGAYGQWLNSNVTTVPTWLKLTRLGNVFTGYASANGTNWTTIGSCTISMTNTIYIGLVNTSCSTSAINIGVLDNVSAPCVAPTGLTQSAIAGQVKLGWTACYGAISYNIKRSTVSGGPYTTIGTVTSPNISYTDTTVSSGNNYYYVVSAVNAMGESPNSQEYAAWLNADVGSVGVSGSCSISATNIFTVKGSGTFISNSDAAYNLTYRTLTGDGTLIARVAQSSYANCMVGIMMTETLNGTSKAASIVYYFNGAYLKPMMCLKPTANLYGQWSVGSATSVPIWLKLVRSGSTFTGYSSPDGITWTTVGSGTISMANTIYMGMVFCSTNNSSLQTGTLDNVTLP